MDEVTFTGSNRRPLSSISRSVKLPGIEACRVELPRGSTYDFSWHGQTHYLAYHDMQLLDGELHNDAYPSVRRLDLRGTFTYLPAGCRVWGWSHLRQSPASFTAIYLNTREMNDEVGQRFVASAPPPAVYFKDQALAVTMAKLHRCLQATAVDRLVVESLCALAILELRGRPGTVAPEATGGGRLSPAQTERVMEFINANLAADIGLDDLAQSVGLSRFHFLRAFRAATGMTPYRCLLERRVERAHELLQRRHSLEEAARLTGFSDSASFSRVFKRIRATSPAETLRDCES